MASRAGENVVAVFADMNIFVAIRSGKLFWTRAAPLSYKQYLQTDAGAHGVTEAIQIDVPKEL